MISAASRGCKGVCAWRGCVRESMVGLHHTPLRMQVRNAQLSKEARELREENVTLQERVELQQSAAVHNEKVRAKLGPS